MHCHFEKGALLDPQATRREFTMPVPEISGITYFFRLFGSPPLL
jgi:hypothetical protein